MQSRTCVQGLLLGHQYCHGVASRQGLCPLSTLRSTYLGTVHRSQGAGVSSTCAPAGSDLPQAAVEPWSRGELDKDLVHPGAIPSHCSNLN